MFVVVSSLCSATFFWHLLPQKKYKYEEEPNNDENNETLLTLSPATDAGSH
jgi:hypothetical protein